MPGDFASERVFLGRDEWKFTSTRGIPTCGFIFVDEELGRLVPYVPFVGSAQSPAFVFRKGYNEGGRLFSYLWGKYLDILECIGEPYVVLDSALVPNKR